MTTERLTKVPGGFIDPEKGFISTAVAQARGLVDTPEKTIDQKEPTELDKARQRAVLAAAQRASTRDIETERARKEREQRIKQAREITQQQEKQEVIATEAREIAFTQLGGQEEIIEPGTGRPIEQVREQVEDIRQQQRRELQQQKEQRARAQAFTEPLGEGEQELETQKRTVQAAREAREIPERTRAIGTGELEGIQAERRRAAVQEAQEQEKIRQRRLTPELRSRLLRGERLVTPIPGVSTEELAEEIQGEQELEQQPRPATPQPEQITDDEFGVVPPSELTEGQFTGPAERFFETAREKTDPFKLAQASSEVAVGEAFALAGDIPIVRRQEDVREFRELLDQEREGFFIGPGELRRAEQKLDLPETTVQVPEILAERDISIPIPKTDKFLFKGTTPSDIALRSKTGLELGLDPFIIVGGAKLGASASRLGLAGASATRKGLQRGLTTAEKVFPRTKAFARTIAREQTGGVKVPQKVRTPKLSPKVERQIRKAIRGKPPGLLRREIAKQRAAQIAAQKPTQLPGKPQPGTVKRAPTTKPQPTEITRGTTTTRPATQDVTQRLAQRQTARTSAIERARAAELARTARGKAQLDVELKRAAQVRLAELPAPETLRKGLAVTVAPVAAPGVVTQPTTQPVTREVVQPGTGIITREKVAPEVSPIPEIEPGTGFRTAPTRITTPKPEIEFEKLPEVQRPQIKIPEAELIKSPTIEKEREIEREIKIEETPIIEEEPVPIEEPVDIPVDIPPIDTPIDIPPTEIDITKEKDDKDKPPPPDVPPPPKDEPPPKEKDKGKDEPPPKGKKKRRDLDIPELEITPRKLRRAIPPRNVKLFRRVTNGRVEWTLVQLPTTSSGEFRELQRFGPFSARRILSTGNLSATTLRTLGRAFSKRGDAESLGRDLILSLIALGEITPEQAEFVLPFKVNIDISKI